MNEQDSPQALTIAEIRERQKMREQVNLLNRWNRDVHDLLNIIDLQTQAIADLQAKKPKQYTKNELLQEFKNRYDVRSDYVSQSIAPWIECAQFLGALKGEP